MTSKENQITIATGSADKHQSQSARFCRCPSGQHYYYDYKTDTFSNERHETTQQIRDKTSGPNFLFSAEEPKSTLPQRNRVSSGLLLLWR